MAAGVRGVLAGASMLGHPLDTAGGYPRVCRGPDWTDVTQLAPGYHVAGEPGVRAKQAARVTALAKLAGGKELLDGLEYASPELTLEVAGVSLERGPSALESLHFASVCAQEQTPYRTIAAESSAIDEVVYGGGAVVARCWREALGLESATQYESYVVVVAVVASWQRGTVGRLVVTELGEAWVMEPDPFMKALSRGELIATRRVLFEPLFPPPSVCPVSARVAPARPEPSR